MPQTNKDKLAGKYVDLDYNLRKARAEGIIDRGQLIEIARPHTDRIALLTGKVMEEEDEPGDHYVPHYSQAERDRIAALPKFKEFAAHTMALTPFVYRFFEQDPRGTTDLVYELVKKLREQGVGVIREFLINGSRKHSEHYIFDALPWEMRLISGRKVIDFAARNNYYFQCASMVDRACLYWDTVHRPTLFMDDYNEDIFKAENNIQGIDGYRSPEAENIKRRFALDYVQSVLQGLKTVEAENEPNHHKDWRLGLTIARNTHDLFMFLKELVMIENFWTCSSSSEFAHADLVEPDKIEIDGELYDIGDAEICPAPRFRKVKPDYHGQTTLVSIVSSGFVSHGLPSAWKYLCSNEDGGAVDGKYNPLNHARYRLADRSQLLETTDYCLRSTRQRGKNWYFTAFMLDCLQNINGINQELYPLPRMDFERISAYTENRLKVDQEYGPIS